MTKSEIRADASVLLRDAGHSRRWDKESLDAAGKQALMSLYAEAQQKNPDFFSHEELITTAATGIYTLSNLAKTFRRPLNISKKDSLAAAQGVQYDPIRPRANSAVKTNNTIVFRGVTTFAAIPAETTTFAFEYQYAPTPWATLGDDADPDIPVEFHPLISLEIAVVTLTMGGRETPGWLGTRWQDSRNDFLGYVERADLTGPIECEATDSAYEYGGI